MVFVEQLQQNLGSFCMYMYIYLSTVADKDRKPSIQNYGLYKLQKW